MATLKEIFGDATRGDGRKFTKTRICGWFFEPIFRVGDLWSGINEKGESENWSHDGAEWVEYTPTKKTKKITLYRPVLKFPCGLYEVAGPWQSEKKPDERFFYPVVAWQTMEVEVDDV